MEGEKIPLTRERVVHDKSEEIKHERLTAIVNHMNHQDLNDQLARKWFKSHPGTCTSLMKEGIEGLSPFVLTLKPKK